MPKKTNFACLDFSRLLVCYSRNSSGLKTIEKPSVAICGGSFGILTGLLTLDNLKRSNQGHIIFKWLYLINNTSHDQSFMKYI